VLATMVNRAAMSSGFRVRTGSRDNAGALARHTVTSDDEPSRGDRAGRSGAGVPSRFAVVRRPWCSSVRVRYASVRSGCDQA
jgi:hypothetical protein